MISPEEVKSIYTQAINHVVKKYSIDSGNTLFIRFLSALPDIFTQDFLSKNKSVEYSFEDIACHDIYPVFLEYTNGFILKQPAIANDDNNRKIRAFDIGYFIELTEDGRLPITKRLEYALRAEKYALDYHFVSSLRPLSENENFILGKIRERIKLLERVIVNSKADELSDLWVYSPDQLKALAERLAEKGFVKNPQIFQQVFSSNCKFFCKWEGKRTLLIYLFHLLFSKQNTFPVPALDYAASKFDFKHGGIVNKHVLYTQSKQIENIFKHEEVVLKEPYLTMFSLHKSVFGKT